MVCHSFPNGQGFLGTNMKPGHVNWDIHGLMYLSRQVIHPDEKHLLMFLFQASTRRFTGKMDPYKLVVDCLLTRERKATDRSDNRA
mmetsp:Transcript_29007/g.44580  ORF Transcript_29007/g.44580 Transcript_29007/m.44580 type:complete len:86 (-) Transcript_29007:205-462(-)